MDITIHLNHEALFGTIKIHNVRSNTMLPPKLKLVKLLSPQLEPKSKFGLGHLGT